MAYDAPAYKFLAHNDTGRAVGHQAGVLIPKALEGYFPSLRAASVTRPTVSVSVEAELVDGSSTIGKVETRYQHQTWGGDRQPERRLTGNLQELLRTARKDDVLLFERSLSQPDRYRLRLLRQGTPAHASVAAKAGNKRWGVLTASP